MQWAVAIGIALVAALGAVPSTSREIKRLRKTDPTGAEQAAQRQRENLAPRKVRERRSRRSSAEA